MGNLRKYTGLIISGIIIALILMNGKGNDKNQVNINSQQGMIVQDSYSNFLSDVYNKKISKVVIYEKSNQLLAFYSNNSQKTVSYPSSDPKMIDSLLENNVQIDVSTKDSISPEEKPSIMADLVIKFVAMIINILLFVGIFLLISHFVSKKMNGGGGSGGIQGMMGGKFKEFSDVVPDVSLSDVAGIDEYKEEVEEIIDFLKVPERYSESGARMPKGILLTGGPGTGKTLLAKAIAGEANVPFLNVAGSDFVEMFVGVGAKRVRELFKKARENAPCIIFVDEIDAIGGKRSESGAGGSNSEREQTLNQLLVEMDGFDSKSGVFVIAATNRSDMLDNALTRAGRFDREISVPLPDVKGRRAILDIHAQKINHVIEDFSVIAKTTVGFSGAELENLVNEAAIISVRDNKTTTDMECFEKAKDRLLMGVSRKSLTMSKEEVESTAYHEAGHAILGAILPEHDSIHKVTIIPRGQALGVAHFMPDRDAVSYSKQKLLSKLITLFGGRVAEEIIYGEDSITTGASNDIQVATNIATRMVTEWGFNDALSIRKYYQGQNGMDNGKPSDEMQSLIDKEIDGILKYSYEKAKEILLKEKDLLVDMTSELLEKETLDNSDVTGLIKKHLNIDVKSGEKYEMK